MRISRPKLNYANVIATIALFVALGGAAVAAGLPKKSVGPQQLKPGAVTTRALHRQAVTAGKLAPKAVTAGKLGANAVLPGNLGNGIITTEKLSDQAVNAAKIKNGAVTTNKLNNGGVTSAKLADGAVNSSKLGDGSVSVNKLGKGVIGQLQGQLESGTTLRGVFALGGDPKISLDSVSFQFPLASSPVAPKENIPRSGQNDPCLSRSQRHRDATGRPGAALHLHHVEIRRIRGSRIDFRRDQPTGLRSACRVHERQRTAERGRRAVGGDGALKAPAAVVLGKLLQDRRGHLSRPDFGDR
jgi:hypothetical protein